MLSVASSWAQCVHIPLGRTDWCSVSRRRMTMPSSHNRTWSMTVRRQSHSPTQSHSHNPFGARRTEVQGKERGGETRGKWVSGSDVRCQSHSMTWDETWDVPHPCRAESVICYSATCQCARTKGRCATRPCSAYSVTCQCQSRKSRCHTRTNHQRKRKRWMNHRRRQGSPRSLDSPLHSFGAQRTEEERRGKGRRGEGGRGGM